MIHLYNLNTNKIINLMVYKKKKYKAMAFRWMSGKKKIIDSAMPLFAENEGAYAGELQ